MGYNASLVTRPGWLLFLLSPALPFPSGPQSYWSPALAEPLRGILYFESFSLSAKTWRNFSTFGWMIARQ
jgi:hypothetical protein